MNLKFLGIEFCHLVLVESFVVIVIPICPKSSIPEPSLSLLMSLPAFVRV